MNHRESVAGTELPSPSAHPAPSVNFSLLAALVATLLAAPVAPAVPAAPAAPAAGQARDTRESVAARLLADVTAIAPGGTFTAGVHLTMAPGWHTYWRDPGDSGLATSIRWQLPAGFVAGDIQWPTPTRIEEPGNIAVNAYRDEVLLMVPITAPPNLPDGPGDIVRLGADVSWLACEQTCIPGGARLDLELPVAVGGPPTAPANAELFAKFRARLPGPAGPAAAAAPAAAIPASPAGAPAARAGVAGGWELVRFLLLALLGGFVLNLMPCVLPVIALKIVGFVRQANEEPRRILALGLAFTAGIFAWFLGLAALVVGFQAVGRDLNWAFQFQSPWFVLGMGAVVLVFAMNLFGVFELTVPGAAGTRLVDLSQREGLGGAFLHGMFATLLATPCTGPFFGTALGFAVSQPPPTTFAIFAAMAVGMGSPYLLLAARPAWLRHLPKPGVWMERLKQFMGFLLMATVVWLLWVIGRQRGPDGMAWAAAFLLMFAIGCWLKGALAVPTAPRRQRIVGWLAILAVVGGGGYYTAGVKLRQIVPPTVAGSAQPFSAQLAAALGRGRTVFVDFTADWCLNCKVNERLVLATPAVQEAFRRHDVLFLKADWTHGDPDITRLLKSFGRAGVPLYVVYPGGDPNRPLVLPELLTPGSVIEAVGKAP